MKNVKVPDDMQVGTVYTSVNCGDFEILEYVNSGDVKIKFLNTGYERSATAINVRNKTVRDPYHPSFYGKGYTGVGEHSTSVNNKHTKIYSRWKGMLERCYSQAPKRREIFKMYDDCEVCDYFLNFQNFASWWIENYPKDGKEYQLDKDKLGDGNNKIYSPETCCFLTGQENTEIAVSKPYRFISPDGVLHEGVNMHKFAKEHRLDSSSLVKLNKGKLKKHKGWTKA
ncbi:hypothetical protein [Haliea sp.]|uniref:hypothetical protein n=1 Tax=Haliea sp. TaxID=1932666 RepID=UPI0025B853C7|nr:hypothetical protein [Haliea sp.]